MPLEAVGVAEDTVAGVLPTNFQVVLRHSCEWCDVLGQEEEAVTAGVEEVEDLGERLCDVDEEEEFVVQVWEFEGFAAEPLLELVQVKVAFLVSVPVLVLRIGNGYQTECNWGHLGPGFRVYIADQGLHRVFRSRKLLSVRC